MLPGTGFLALAAVAETSLVARGASREEERQVALRDIEFVDALIVPEGERVEIRVRRDERESRFGIESRQAVGAPWRLHARGRIGAASGPVPTIDLDLLRTRCVRDEDPAAVSTEAPHLAFGPRWDNVKRIRVAQREAMLELELAPRFAGDLALLPLHPALMDMALAGAQALVPWLDRATQVLVPLALGTLRVYGPLPRQVISRVRYREDLSTPGDVAVFDAAVCDDRGRVLVEALELSLLALRDTTRLASAPAGIAPRPREHAAANPLLALTIREGIRAREGMEALERIIASNPPPQVVVSPLPLEPLLAEFRSHVTAAPVARTLAGDKASEPMSPMERDIANIASGLLGAARVGPDDNLIDLGLHSLLAVRLFTRLKKLTGKNLPLATLLEAPTVRGLAERFGLGADDAEGGEGGAGGATDLLTSSDMVRDRRAHAHWLRPLWSHVVPLKPTGTLPPFFSIHARGGAVLNYRTLATFVDPEQPLYGIQCRGLDGRTEPFRSIEEMADQYLDEIRRIQPHGPYFLGGGSLGGVVGLEIAERLRAEGERVGLIAMFDSWGPVWFAPNQQPGDSSRLWRKLNAHMERLRRQGAVSGSRLLWMGLQRRVVTRARLAAARVLRTLGIELPHNLRYFYVEHANLAALQRFTPNKYDGDIVLFRALDDPDADFSDPTMGWRGSVLGDIEIIDAPGTHNSIVHDAVFGELFRQRLRRAQADTGGSRGGTGDSHGGTEERRAAEGSRLS
jgi:thioesterase domain-containing protein/aryl carrier-like protein